MQTSKRNLLITAVAFLWFLAIILLYYVTHKPFDPAFAVQWVVTLWRVIVVGVILSVAGGLGRKLFRLDAAPELVQASVQAGLGLGLDALVVLALGVTVGLNALILWGIVLLSAVLLRKEIFEWWRCWQALPHSISATRGLTRWIAAYLAVALACTFLLAVAPPVKFDALVYHLLMPETYQSTGRVAYLPWLMMSGMPQTAEMLYTWAAGLGAGLSGSALLGWAAGVVAIAGVFGLAESELGSRPAWVACAALLSGYSLVVSLSWGYVDWFTLLFGLGVFISLDRWITLGSRRYLVFAGIFAGLALGTKVPAGFMVIVGAMVILWVALRSKRGWFVSPMIFGLTALAVSLPWWLKNLVTTGNPIYPLLFESGAMTQTRLGVFQNAPTWGDWTDLAALPIRATLSGIDGGAGYSLSIGPLLLALAGCAWLSGAAVTGRQRSLRWLAGIVSLLGVLVWTAGNQFSGFLIQTRMYLGIFPAVCLLAGLGYQQLSSLSLPGVRINRLVDALIVLVLALNLVEIGVHTASSGALQYTLGIEDSQQYLEDNLGAYAPAMQAIRDLPEGEKVLLLVEARGLYCTPKCSPDETLDRWPRAYTQYHDPQQIIAAWKAEGFTQIMYYKTGAKFLRDTRDINHTEEQWAALDDFLAGLPDPVDFYDAYALYRLP
ncbi:MAG TPA: hypothetical protein VHO48_04780 [Anaerolineaceae bacterium]|nr:hypothetical protein [Anaerolineaceae bacterium]